ncbi:hypothetical protein DZA65_01553 [Dickeya dianthicola]|uniref:DNA methylase n=1 Tax=Dickeya dianthicola TaxID=204039 RepID=A0ABX9NPV2_9GAMM|nr:hypothetical protein [Dickeya dianthicola]AYC18446.1 hypothetical protein DZA65_01553 [Dickeya dianthicola]MBI0439432.1 hypothetical protein [Dickeya dianthicola]MBI0449834.1 hypothetical protein [Dickeya dianthicola]MBI0454971.1 hypothetical protein [Dickeya dianthicola]MBI0459092.1 hypothetical protein [Dickeya dianthicola]
MAASPSHKLGQLIGNILESLFAPLLQDIADKSGLYLDVVGQPRKARKGKKITWEDAYGSTHDLDFVFEYSGNETTLGRPVAFIESAWRRYTKHSKNKAQEIQGAVLPIVNKYQIECPFKGAILAGEFTEPSLKQLKSSGFQVMYIPYNDFVTAFSDAGIDMSFDESTSEKILSEKVMLIEQLEKTQLEQVKESILKSNQSEIKEFITALEWKVQKILKHIVISPLYGHNFTFETIDEAKNFITNYNSNVVPDNLHFNTFIIHVKYMNGDTINAELSSTNAAIEFLTKILS